MAIEKLEVVGQIEEKESKEYDDKVKHSFTILRLDTQKKMSLSLFVSDSDEGEKVPGQNKKNAELVKTFKKGAIGKFTYYDNVNGKYTYHNIIDIVSVEDGGQQSNEAIPEEKEIKAPETKDPVVEEANKKYNVNPKSYVNPHPDTLQHNKPTTAKEQVPQSVWDKKDTRYNKQQAATRALGYIQSVLKAVELGLMSKEKFDSKMLELNEDGIFMVAKKFEEYQAKE